MRGNPKDEAGATGEIVAAAKRARSTRLRNLGGAALTLLLDLLLIDAAVETWRIGSPLRWWVVAPVALYVATTAWLVLKRVPFGRGPGWFTLPATPLIVLLGVVAVCAGQPEGMIHGVRLLRQPTSVVLSGATLLVLLLAAFCLLRPRGARWWARLLVGGLAAYAAVALGVAIAIRTPYTHLLQHGQGFWPRLPYWLQGPFVGAFVLIPMAIVWEIGLALVRLVVRGRLALILLLAIGLCIAWLGATVAPN